MSKSFQVIKAHLQFIIPRWNNKTSQETGSNLRSFLWTFIPSSTYFFTHESLWTVCQMGQKWSHLGSSLVSLLVLVRRRSRWDFAEEPSKTVLLVLFWDSCWNIATSSSTADDFREVTDITRGRSGDNSCTTVGSGSYSVPREVMDATCRGSGAGWEAEGRANRCNLLTITALSLLPPFPPPPLWLQEQLLLHMLHEGLNQGNGTEDFSHSIQKSSPINWWGVFEFISC